MEITKEELYEQYYVQELSTTQIAKNFDTYPNKINRLLKKFGYQPRSRSESQAIVCKTTHPTRGKKRTEEEKIAISKGGANSWSDERRAQASEYTKEQWENRSEEEKSKILKKAHSGLVRAAKEGSRLEKFLLEFLRKHEINALAHENLLVNEKLEVDLLLTNKNIVIELDGPTHFKPIFGEEKLQQQLAADAEKDALLTGMGFRVIRIVTIKKNMSDNDFRTIGEKALELINSREKVIKWLYE